jgi:hypothetical protein
MSIAPRTVSVTVEISDADLSLTSIKAIVRASLEAENIGRIRTITLNVIQGTRRKAKKAAKKK